MYYYNTGSGLFYNSICFSSFLDLPQSSLSVCPLLWSSYLLGWYHLFSDSRLLWFSILWSRWDSLYATFCWLFFATKINIQYYCILIFVAKFSRKVVKESAHNNTERYCGWFWAHCFAKKFERMAREAMNVCLWVLKESNKGRFDSPSVRNSGFVISHITFRYCPMHIFFWPFSK